MSERLNAEVDRHSGVRIDGAYCKSDEDLLLYKGFEFFFTKACWAVTDYHVQQVKSRFMRLGLLSPSQEECYEEKAKVESRTFSSRSQKRRRAYSISPGSY